MAPGDTLPDFLTNTPLDPSFQTDMLDTHLVYDYDAQDGDGNPEKWRYELWVFSSKCIIYAVHGGPMAGRVNYQRANFQCIRPGGAVADQLARRDGHDSVGSVRHQGEEDDDYDCVFRGPLEEEGGGAGGTREIRRTGRGGVRWRKWEIRGQDSC
ncbi:Phenolic acid decarboxylase [Pyrenophora tritici-repentis]|uniref:Phenolic acid decarboxylase n=1 Tax=Pyrenophora tritici-repentis TaxID=45151 RepID=A0A834RNJ9_9PLEO|nr:Phenolic acid decarboxylase [Pyrenophora tritici-repentis]